ncbi:MAG: NADP-dependent isocitrate dehydrogenase [Candidatus Hydrogenedens sp.]|nr:NADP-dependent isocitrate dehydrogenase [Candidatus Hydrogenedens sp.]
MPEIIPITVARGDGIGPEIMDATLRVLEAAKAAIVPEFIEIGESVYERGFSSGIEPDAWESIRRTGVLLKAPITTPQGGGVKSLNVTLRKTLGLFANVRPCRSYAPFVETHHPFMDLVIIRENEEDLYAGIEHRQTRQVTQCLKLITKPGCERILRYAFEYTRSRGRKKLSCMTKDNIMKLTDGMFHRIFRELSKEYPDIETEHLIIDIGMARVADAPDRFDVIVTPNLYGDILSDVAAQVSGSVGMCPSANYGITASMFEAIHGSAPDIAGQNIANPSALLLSAVKMLSYLSQSETAMLIHNAWLKTIEDGFHTIDIFSHLPNYEHQRLGTNEFADAVIERLGDEPQTLKTVRYKRTEIVTHPEIKSEEVKELVGVDVFFDWDAGTPDDLGAALQAVSDDRLSIRMVSNRGVKVWPGGIPETYCTDHWRARFKHPEKNMTVEPADVIALLQRCLDAGLDFIKTEHLYMFDGKRGYSLSQGQ